MNAREKLAVAAALFVATWTVLVAIGKAPVPEFINAIRDTLIGLSVFAATMTTPNREEHTMKRTHLLFSVLFALLAAGCASLRHAGMAEYSVKPVIVEGRRFAVKCW